MSITRKGLSLLIAKRAGATIKKGFRLKMKKRLKPDRTPVTQTDLAANKMVLDLVHKHFSQDSVLAEEESHMHKNSEYVWVCDPIDGTLPFTRGIPTCVFSLALTKNGEPIMGVISDPFTNRLFFAEKGKGALLNGKKIRVSTTKKLNGALIGLAYWPKAKYNLSLLDTTLIRAGANILKVGSITYLDALVAAGEIDATVCPAMGSHDTAAAKVIVEEAGGKVTDFFGREQRYDGKINGAVVSNKKLHKKLLNLMKKTVKRQ